MDFTYKKKSNKTLFDDIKEKDSLEIDEPQNFIPIYNNFFNLSESNYNSITLNNQNNLEKVKEKYGENTFMCKINDFYRPVFFKFTPLINYIDYFGGKYENDNILQLPQLNSNNDSDFMKRLNNPNNSAYVDGFFNYLSSKLLCEENFKNGIDFYGSFLGIKNNFIINIEDEEEIEYFNNSTYFHEHNGKDFTINSDIINDYINFDTRTNKKHLNITNLDSSYVFEVEDINIITEKSETNDKDDTESLMSGSSCSSDTENTSESENSYSDSEYSDYSSITDEYVTISVNKYPVQAIALEKCESTLDEYLRKNINEISDTEMGSIIMQIIMSLLLYQKVFEFTHNDLHTNNIMYITTNIEHLYYKFNDKTYKVPTFGKIYKIIDFGRSIYTFKKQLIYSDCFEEDGDAHTQYNFDPILNKSKPIVKPNYSFDLCRLACSIYDMIDDKTLSNDTALGLILEWCIDDNGKHILYKKNGKERYMEFKLYKMIARIVHNHTPEKVLQKEYFNKFEINNENVHDLLDIDSIYGKYNN